MCKSCWIRRDVRAPPIKRKRKKIDSMRLHSVACVLCFFCNAHPIGNQKELAIYASALSFPPIPTEKFRM